MSTKNESSEMEEFMELAKNANSDSGLSHAELFDDDESDEQEGVAAGKLVQYAKNGPGFTPTTATVATLAPGVYEIDTINQIPTFVPRHVITDSLLRLPDSKSDEVIAEVERFWTLKHKFTQYGFTHKRGFLLWGPPGSGKTSTLAFIMSEMVQRGGLVVLGDTHPATLSSMLGNLRQVEPERPLVVVLEDIDTIIENYGESRVLSLLDGENSIDNVVFLATTNYPENLDGRVVNRPSRFDRVVKIGMPNEEARSAYIHSRMPELSEVDLALWVSLTKNFSLAHIKELIVSVCCFGNELKETAKRLKEMAQ
jgi:hypothetical protein